MSDLRLTPEEIKNKIGYIPTSGDDIWNILDAQLDKLSETTDEILEATTLKYLRDKYDTWEATTCEGCCDFESGFCNMCGMDVDQLKTCPQADLAFPNNARELLSQISPVFKAREFEEITKRDKRIEELQQTCKDWERLSKEAVEEAKKEERERIGKWLLEEIPLVASDKTIEIPRHSALSKNCITNYMSTGKLSLKYE
jgi:hypothetical protein